MLQYEIAHTVPSFLIVDNFYEDPDFIRNTALSMNIDIPGHFSGLRSNSFLHEFISDKIENILQHKIEFQIESTEEITYNGCFFINNNTSDKWIHDDIYFDDNNYITWSCIVYLTPNAPYNSGTTFYKKDTNNNFIKTDKIGNLFNRALIFQSHLLHEPSSFFGTDKNNSRLTQVFWFHTKKKSKQINTLFNYNFSKDIIVINNVLHNPDDIRNFALKTNFDRDGNNHENPLIQYPGKRTRSFAHDSFKYILQNIIGKTITCFTTPTNEDFLFDNGAFQYACEYMKSWIHKDNDFNYAAIIYLTPDAPLYSGTDFYNDDEELIDNVSNVYNRLIIFNSQINHCAGEYFGNNLQNCRIFQIFLFSVGDF